MNIIEWLIAWYLIQGVILAVWMYFKLRHTHFEAIFWLLIWPYLLWRMRRYG